MKRLFGESGIRKAYQLFLVLRILFWLFLNEMQSLFSPGMAVSSGPFSFAEIVILVSLDMMLLSISVIPHIREILGTKFYPLYNFFTVSVLFLAHFWWETGNLPNPTLPYNPLISPLFILYFMTLILYSWQHRLAVMIGYIAGVILVNVVIMLYLYPNSDYSVVVPYIIFGGVFFLVAWTVSVLIKESKRDDEILRIAHDKERKVHARIAAAVLTREELVISRERNRLARELHDTLAHSLSALSVQLEAAKSIWEEAPGRAREIVEDAHTTVGSSLGEARDALMALRAKPLEDLGLLLGCRELLEQGAQRLGARCSIGIPDASFPTDLLQYQEHGVYRILQEGVENVVRHSQAERVALLITMDGKFQLRLEDNGLGFAVSDQNMDRGGMHYGIQGMKERALIIGGVLTISSSPGKGTALTLRIDTSTEGSSNVQNTDM